MEIPFRSKEVSWLSFNSRVLQEGANPDVPLLERIKFLGIYSSNLDEFFRVRVATLKRLVTLGNRYLELNIPNPKLTLRKVNGIIADETIRFNEAYNQALIDLESNGIRVISNREVPDALRDYLRDYFNNTVRPHLMPIMLKSTTALPRLKDFPMYLAVRMARKNGTGRPSHALLEIPADLDRFVVLPEKKGYPRLVMYLDDIIRFGLPEIFGALHYNDFESYAIKFTRDAEIEFDDDFTESVYDKVSEGLRARETGAPVRANYDYTIPAPFLRMLLRKLKLTHSDSNYGGSRYHNRKDLIGFPTLGRKDLQYPKSPSIPHRRLKKKDSDGFFNILRKRDILLHFPYHNFNNFIDFLREASIDPYVQSIQFTQYRVGKHSCVAKALMSAARNGKMVTALVEPQARFDEQANMAWANQYQNTGVRVILGVPGLKVHSKLCLITRKENGKLRHYTCLGTGNFNEDSAGVFADHLLLTSNAEIGEDTAAVFRFFEKIHSRPSLKHLVAAPLGLRDFLFEKIRREIELAKQGRPATLALKINNLSDLETVTLLYEAAEAGVKIRIIARSMFSLITEQKGPIGENIEAISIVDRYLEHSRVLIFGNDGDPEVYLSSADLLPRNFDSRIEIVFPLLDKKLRQQLIDYFEIQWRDNIKARILDHNLSNQYRARKRTEKKVRAQFALEEYLREM